MANTEDELVHVVAKTLVEAAMQIAMEAACRYLQERNILIGKEELIDAVISQVEETLPPLFHQIRELTEKDQDYKEQDYYTTSLFVGKMIQAGIEVGRKLAQGEGQDD